MNQATSRRSLLTGLAATAMTLAASQTAEAARRPFFARTGKRLGLQLYSLGDEAGKDLAATFASVAAIGYRDIELPQLYGKTPIEMRALADRAGLSLTSLHLPAMAMGGAGALSLLSDTQRVVDDLGVLGITGAVAPIAPFPAAFRPGPGENPMAALARMFVEAGADGWKRTAALLNEKAAALKPHGIQVGYHNHNIEFAPIGGTTGWDILVKETDPALVKFEIDVGWIAAAGLDPVAFLNRHRDRLRWLHAKDIKPSTKANFALSMDPTEAGAGKQDWARILPAAHRAGVEHFYVEQEPPFTIFRIEAARRSWNFLSQVRA
jgi:sugar phosphate isomerase/epimerase